MLPLWSEKRVTLPLLARRGKCAPLWQMNDVKQTYLYSFRAEEEENPSVTDVMGNRYVWVCMHLGVCLRHKCAWAGSKVSIVFDECMVLCVSWYRVCKFVFVCFLALFRSLSRSLSLSLPLLCVCIRGHFPVTCLGCVMNEEERCLQSQRDLVETLFYGVKNGCVLRQRQGECY